MKMKERLVWCLVIAVWASVPFWFLFIWFILFWLTGRTDEFLDALPGGPNHRGG